MILNGANIRRIVLNDQNGERATQSNARERILEAATALFSQKGYASSSVREIVELAGVTKPVLYYYFKNKEGLFRAILEWAVQLQEDVLHSVMEKPGTMLERIIHLSQQAYQRVMENKNLLKMIHMLVFGPPQGVPSYDFNAYHRRMIGTIQSIYMEGLANGEVINADPEEIAMLFLSLIDFCFHWDHVHPELSDSRRAERLLTLAYNGIKAG